MPPQEENSKHPLGCVCSPETQKDPMTLVDQRTGGINIIDLANVYSCAFIATQDLGKTYSDGRFSLLGRFDHSDIRGCNLLLEA